MESNARLVLTVNLFPPSKQCELLATKHDFDKSVGIVFLLNAKNDS